MNTYFIQQSFNKALLLLYFIFLCVPNLSFAQKKKTGSLEYLKSCNGFKDIVLGADINNIKYEKLTYTDSNGNRLDADSCLKFSFADSSLLKIEDDLSLEMVGVRTYKDKIVNIYLFFSKADEYKILSNFLSVYGTFTSKPIEFKNIYNWDSSLVSLSLISQPNVEDGVAIFTCNPLIASIAEAKTIATEKARIKAIKESMAAEKAFSSTTPDAVAGSFQ